MTPARFPRIARALQAAVVLTFFHAAAPASQVVGTGIGKVLPPTAAEKKAAAAAATATTTTKTTATTTTARAQTAKSAASTTGH